MAEPVPVTVVDPAARPLDWRDPTTWRLARAWQLWAMAMMTLEILVWTFGAEPVLAAVSALWGAV